MAHRAILPYASPKAVGVVLVFGVPGIVFQWISTGQTAAFNAAITTFLLVWIVAWAGRERHELDKVE